MVEGEAESGPSQTLGLSDASVGGRLRELPPSAKLVALILHRADEPLTGQEISDRSLLPKRTTRYALTRLDEHDIVETQRLSANPHQQRYTLGE